MYGKMKTLSIEELEVEIEDLDIMIAELKESVEDIDRCIVDLVEKKTKLNGQMAGLRVLSEICSDLILEKQKEEGAQ